MDNQRLLIWAFFGLMVWMTYQTWLQDNAPPPAPATEQPQSALQGDSAIANNGIDALPDIADAAGPDDITTVAPMTDDAIIEKATSATPVIRVSTDVFEIEISTKGGTLQSATLLAYPVAKNKPDTLVRLLSSNAVDLGLIRTGILMTGGDEQPDHEAMFESQRDHYTLDGADELVVPITWQNSDGVTVEKRFFFKRGNYAIRIEQEVTNRSEGLWRGAQFAQILRYSREHERSMFDVDSYSFTGPIIYNGEKSEKLKRKDLLKDGAVKFTTSAGWIGSIQHHFLSAVVPEAGSEQSYNVAADTNLSAARVIGAAQTVAPGSSKTFSTTAFVGPKLQSQLEKLTKA